MATRKRVDSWVVTDDYWQRVEPLIPLRERAADKEYLRKPGAGRPPKPARQVFEAVVYVLRTGYQWKALPKERFGSASAVHERFLEWEAAGVFQAIWQAGLAEYDQMEGIAWAWQSIDRAMFKAPLVQEAVGRNPTDLGKNGQQATPVGGRPWRPVVARRSRANEHDVMQLEQVLTAIMVKRMAPSTRRSKHLCADAGYRGRRALEIIESHGYIPHVVGRHTEADAKRRNSVKKGAATLNE